MSAKRSLMCLDVIRAPPSPLSPHSSFCLRLSVRSPAGPTRSSVRPQRPPPTPGTHEGELAGTRRGRGGKLPEHCWEISRRSHCSISHIHPICSCRFPSLFLTRCSPWKHVKKESLSAFLSTTSGLGARNGTVRFCFFVSFFSPSKLRGTKKTKKNFFFCWKDGIFASSRGRKTPK